MAPLTKVAIVTSGYLLAFFIAWLALQAYVASTPMVDRSTGMSAFGDSVYFLAAYGVAAVPATAIALCFLRPYGALWRALSAFSLIAMVLTVLAATVNVAHVASNHPLAALSPLWILATPLFAGAFLLSGLFAPTRSSRVALLATSGIQIVAFGCVMLSWWIHSHAA